MRRIWNGTLLGPAVILLLMLAAVSAGCAANALAPMCATRDIPYTSASGVEKGLQSLDIYVPETPPVDPMPVVIWIHGGGWAIGDKRYQMRYKPVLFTDAGYCFVSINYRLSPRRPTDTPDRIMYPIHEQDVASAIAWVHAHIADYHGDPGRIALMGHSAGAHLAAIVSTDERYLSAHGLPLSTIKGTASLDTEGYDIVSTMGFLPGNRIYLNAFGDDTSAWAAASPINHLAPGKGTPPFLLVSRGTVFRQHLCEAFADALRSTGTPVTVVNAPSYSHQDVNACIGMPGEKVITPPLMEFLKTCFGTMSAGEKR